MPPQYQCHRSLHSCEHLRVASDHAVAPHWFEKHREILRHDRHGIAKVVRALCYLRDSAKGNRAEIEREFAFFRKHRHRMLYHALKEQGIAIGSGGVEAANKVLVTQRMKRSGMRWCITGGQAVLTFRARIKSGHFDRAWDAIITTLPGSPNDNTRSNEVRAIATCPQSSPYEFRIPLDCNEWQVSIKPSSVSSFPGIDFSPRLFFRCTQHLSMPLTTLSRHFGPRTRRASSPS